jgi:hypothetical protein
MANAWSPICHGTEHEMIDEASHKMARAIVARGRAAGLGHDDPPGGHHRDDSGRDAGIGSEST